MDGHGPAIQQRARGGLDSADAEHQGTATLPAARQPLRSRERDQTGGRSEQYIEPGCALLIWFKVQGSMTSARGSKERIGAQHGWIRQARFFWKKAFAAGS